MVSPALRSVPSFRVLKLDAGGWAASSLTSLHPQGRSAEEGGGAGGGGPAPPVPAGREEALAAV